MKTGGDPTFLIVSLRYIGDVLLSTPLALSIRTHIPGAEVDYLVFEGTEGVLAKNPLVRKVHTIRPRGKSLRSIRMIWKQYDYAIGSNPSDRTTIHSFAAGRRSIGFSGFQRKEWWKKRLLTVCRPHNDRIHIVPAVLSQLDTLGITQQRRVVMGFDGEDETFARKMIGGGDYVLLHPYARREYKLWPSTAWGELAGFIRERLGLAPVFTASPAPEDTAVLDRILAYAPPGTRAFPHPFTLPQLAAAIRGSMAFVGVDTVATHMAAALDVPTVALYGPTLTRYWGPWPNGSTDDAPYADHGCLQRRGRITVIQKDWPCVPCNKGTCDLSGGGRILCLEELSAADVAEELFLAVGSPRAGKGA